MPRSNKQPEHFRLEIDRVARRTDAAVLIEVDGEEHWIPKSQIHEDHGDQPHDAHLLVTPWILKQKGLI